MEKGQKVKSKVDRELPLKLKIFGSGLEQYLKTHDFKIGDIPSLYSADFDIMRIRKMMSELQEKYEEGLLKRDEYLSEHGDLTEIIMAIQFHNAIFSGMVIDKLSLNKDVKHDQKLALKFINTAKQVVADLGIRRADIVLETIERVSSEISGVKKYLEG